MSRILFAWELGGGYGHLGPFQPIAGILAARGHEMTVAAREVENAAVAFGSLPVRIVQAPVCMKSYGALEEPPLNYAEILMRYGYLDAPQLSGLLQAWRGTLHATRADILIVDHAPTALLATRGASIARAAIGAAFTVPSPMSPTPNMRSWISVPQQRLESSDATVLRTINTSLPAGVAPLGAVHEIFDGVTSLLSGVAALDPYGPRDPQGFLGLYSGTFGSAPARWPQGKGPRIFAYLSDEYPHLEQAMAALVESGAPCLAYCRVRNRSVLQKYLGRNILFSEKPLDLEAAVAGCDLCVCHANGGTVMSVLRGGKPMLLLPIQLEHFLLSSRLKAMGIADVVHPDERPLDFAGALAGALCNPALAEAARAFASRHGESPVGTIVQRAADRIEALAHTGSRGG